MAKTPALFSLALAASLLAACATESLPHDGRFHGRYGERGPRVGPPGARGGFGVRLFISPAGEPFRREPGGGEPIDAWWQGADANHDGALSRDELTTDFTRYFRVLDTDHDGIISDAEILAYEHSLPEILGLYASGGPPADGATGPGGEGPGPGGRGGRRRGGGGMGGGERSGAAGAGIGIEGAARYGLLNDPEPIRSADSDLSQSVTLAEFQAKAARVFAILDLNGDGQITREELPRRPGVRGRAR